jgi:pimeloyl-ACP methyl ester carboxylesterase
MKTSRINIKSYAKTTLKQELYWNESDVLTFILPGKFYTLFGPSLYYATNISFELGFDTLLIEYGYQRANIDFNMENYDDIVAETYEAIMKALSMKDYKKIVIIGKSIGTSIISSFIEKLEKDYEVISVLLTPTQGALQLFKVRKALVVIGDKDPFVSIENLEELNKFQNLEIHVVHGADHSLDLDTVENSLTEMKIINKILKDYLIKYTS